MRKNILFSIVPVVAAAGSVLADSSALNEAVRARSEGALLEESTAWEQAAVEAGLLPEYGAELRPSMSETEAGVALRIYLPNRWSRAALRERLMMVAQTEKLRVAALEWRELLAVYRGFSRYRMLDKQRALYAEELAVLKPYLAQADAGVEQHQFSVADRAKLYGCYLDWLNDRDQAEEALVAVAHQLQMALGDSVDLAAFARSATIALPAENEVGALVQSALADRADYRRLDAEVRSLNAAEKAARAEEGFRFKYIQPEYSMDTDGSGDDEWSVSAAFVLPWGNRNRDAAAYTQKRELTLSAMNLQRQLIEERVRVLIHTAQTSEARMARRQQMIQPLIDQLNDDLQQLEHGPLTELFDRLSIRERILDTALQTTRTECACERIAVELAEELGSFDH